MTLTAVYPTDANTSLQAAIRDKLADKIKTGFVELILLEGEPCADAPGGVQAWVDRDHVLERLEEVVRQCRSATASKD